MDSSPAYESESEVGLASPSPSLESGRTSLNVDMIHFILEGFDLGVVVFFLLAKHNFLEKIFFVAFFI